MNQYYKDVSLSSLSKAENYTLKIKKEANWLIKSLEQRDNTLTKVMKAILGYQRDFFDYGIQYLKPLVLKEIAEQTNLHESTISRCTTNKYVHTHRGTFELKFFFSTKISTTAGPGFANETIKHFLKEMIKKEDKQKTTYR